jgi:hypothetical protein
MSPLRRIQRNIGNMSAMLQRAGINQVSFADAYLESSFAAAVRACLSCPNAELCGNWLGAEDRTIDRIPEFCPNGAQFEALKNRVEMRSSATTTRGML